jgi:tetratricopeptide (TPR) repeat protein
LRVAAGSRILKEGVERLMASVRVSSMQRFVLGLVSSVVLAGMALAQVPASSSSTGSQVQESGSTPRPRAGQPEAGGAPITLETSETLFDVATALNACGYDGDLADSQPVRAAVRADISAAVAESGLVRQSEDKLCQYFTEHQLNDRARGVAQYVSLALYVGPAPGLIPTTDLTELPPDALQVVNVLPLLRDFAAKVQLHAVWAKHRAEYEAATDRVHDAVTKTILDTNLYLKVPVSSYDGRRLLILVEPMLAPNAPNARIYASDYVVVTSPNAAGAIKLDEIRHLYLHYQVEPLVYARAQSMLRLTPLLKPVEDAPVDYLYKTDVVALVTECMIKAIEARTMNVGFSPPVKPTGSRARVELAKYDEELGSYQRQAEVVRRRQVVLDMRQGWVLVDYFYNEFAKFEHQPEGLGEAMGEMVYGMDVQRVRHDAMQIAFLPVGSGEVVNRVAKAPSGLALAEKKMLSGDLDGAEELADRALADPKQDHSDAMYMKARVMLMQGDPKDSLDDFEDVLRSSHNPHTLAWSHVYLGRLYDTKDPPERQHAIAEYKAALNVPAIPPDARAAAEKGVKVAFDVPKVVHQEEEPLDPSGKAEKAAYKPDEPEQTRPAAKPPQ